MSKIKYTKTATFLFPLLEIPKSLFDCKIKKFGKTVYTTRFLNAYLKNDCITKYKSNEDIDYIFLAIRNYRDVDFESFYSTLTALPNYIDSYDNKDCLIAVFSIPEETQMDFSLIIKGKYSKLTSNGKKLILANNFFSFKNVVIPLILNKSEVLKENWEEKLSTELSPVNLGDQEVWAILDIEEETLNKKILNSLVEKQDLLPTGEFH